MRLLATAALLSGVLAPCAFAQDSTPEARDAQPAATSSSYVSLYGGYVGAGDYSYSSGPELEADVEAGSAFGGAWGTRMGGWRFELAGHYRAQDLSSELSGAPLVDDGSVSAFTLDLNAFIDLAQSGPVRPYIGAGVGVAGINVDDGVINDTGDALHLQAMIGADFYITPQLAVFVEGRAEHLRAKIELDNGFTVTEEDLDLSSAGVFAGLKVAL